MSLVLTLCAACARSVDPHAEGGVPAFDAPPTTDASTCRGDGPVVVAPVTSLDLLVVVDNSGSMRENQSNLLAQLRPLIESLTSPPDLDMDGRPDYPPIRDLHVGVVSTDLGTPGATVPGCANSDLGDDGLLNPIRYGQALARHQPWTGSPVGFRPDDCNRPDQFPAFIAFASGTTDVARFTHDFHCNVALYVNGCGLEQPLEAAYRAVRWHRADDRPGNTDPNAGFLRSEALLAILVLSDEEDGSVRDCRFAESGIPCTDAIDVYQMASLRWAAPNLNMRFYMYAPGGEQDPTWPLERYVDPRNPTRGFFGLKPGHPERVLFAAIAGVPLDVPTHVVGGETQTDWDASSVRRTRRITTTLSRVEVRRPTTIRRIARAPSRCVRPIRIGPVPTAWCPHVGAKAAATIRFVRHAIRWSSTSRGRRAASSRSRGGSTSPLCATDDRVETAS